MAVKKLEYPFLIGEFRMIWYVLISALSHRSGILCYEAQGYIARLPSQAAADSRGAVDEHGRVLLGSMLNGLLLLFVFSRISHPRTQDFLSI